MSIILIISIIVQTITATETKASREAQAILSMLLDTVFIELIEDVEDTVLYRLGRFEETVQETKTEDIINKEAETLAIKVYPNPAKNEFTIEFSETDKEYEVNVYSVLGINVITERVNTKSVTKHTLNIRGYEKGVYLLKRL